jgi:hypothetical protein
MLTDLCPYKLDPTSLTSHVRIPGTLKFKSVHGTSVRLVRSNNDFYDRGELLDVLASQNVPKQRQLAVSPARECRSDTGTPYGLAALRNATEELQDAVDGEHHLTANRVFFSIGSLVGGGELNEEHARTELEKAFEQIDWNRPRPIDNYWRSFDDGKEQPRSAPPALIWGQAAARARLATNRP